MMMPQQIPEEIPDLEYKTALRPLGLLASHLAGCLFIFLVADMDKFIGGNVLRATFAILGCCLGLLALGLISIGLLEDTTRHRRRLGFFYIGSLLVNLFFTLGFVETVGETSLQGFIVPLILIWVVNLNVVFAIWLGGGGRALCNEVRIVQLLLTWVLSDAEDGNRGVQADGKRKLSLW